MIEIGNHHTVGEFRPGLDLSLWIWVDGQRVFGGSVGWLPAQFGEAAARHGLDADAVASVVAAYFAGTAARRAAADAAEAQRRAAADNLRAATLAAEAERERTRRQQRQCAHRAQTSRTVGYTGSSPGTHGDREAAGGVTYIDVCRCGAERYTDANGAHADVGHWLID